MKTICFYNHKGGVGKTTLTAAIAGELITKGKKVILVDTDSQAYLTSQFYPADPDSMEYELADYLYDNHRVSQAGLRDFDGTVFLVNLHHGRVIIQMV